MTELNAELLTSLLRPATDPGGDGAWGRDYDVFVYYRKGVGCEDFSRFYDASYAQFGMDAAAALAAEPAGAGKPLVVATVDMDTNDVPVPWGDYMDVSTIVFYPGRLQIPCRCHPTRDTTRLQLRLLAEKFH